MAGQPTSACRHIGKGSLVCFGPIIAGRSWHSTGVAGSHDGGCAGGGVALGRGAARSHTAFLPLKERSL